MDPIPDLFEWQYTVEGGAGNQFGTSIDGGGSFSALRAYGRGRIAGPPSKSIRLSLEVAYANTDYDFGVPFTAGCISAAACFRGSPWGTIHTVDVATGAALVLNDGIQLLAIVPFQWSIESGAEASGFTAGFIGAVRLRFAERFVTTLGVGVQTEIDDETVVFPVISLDWRFTDHFSLQTRGDPYQGGDAALVWSPAPALQFMASAGWENRRFRLAFRPPNASGVGQYNAVPVLAGIRINFGKQTFIEIEGGVAVAGRLRIDNRVGFTLREEDFDTAGLLRGRLSITF
jgi:hypothetical protein